MLYFTLTYMAEVSCSWLHTLHEYRLAGAGGGGGKRLQPSNFIASV